MHGFGVEMSTMNETVVFDRARSFPFPPPSRPLLGFGLCFANALIFTLSNVLVKRASALDTFSICIFRFCYIALHALPVNIYYGYDPFPRGT